MNQPHVYIAITTFHPLVGGAETQAIAQARTLRERGLSTTVITFHHDKKWARREQIDGIPVIRVAGSLLGERTNLPRKLQQMLYLLALLVMCWRLWWDRGKYDVLHVYQLSSLAFPAALACWLARKPSLYFICSSGTGGATRSHSDASLIKGVLKGDTSWLKLSGISWVNGDIDALKRLGGTLTHFTRWLLLRGNAVIISSSTRIKSYLAENDFLLPGARLIPSGVNIERFSVADESTFEQRARTVLCVSKLRYEKGIDVLLQAWYLVQQQCPEARLIIVGSSSIGTDAVENKLLRMAEELQLGDSVEFAGLRKDVPDQLRRGAISILPSRFEGMPNALLEAMSCGLASVATRVSGSEDIIQHEVNGLLVDVEDYEAMAQALLRLLKDPDLTRQFSKAGRQTIEQHYAFDYILDIYIKLYEQMTHHRPQEKEVYTIA